MMCFHKGPLVLNYAVIWTLYFSHFFTGLYRICLCAKVHNLVIIVGIDCATDKSKRWMKAACSWMRDTLFCHQFSPQNAKNHILRLWSVKIFWGSMPLADTIGQTCPLLQFLLKLLMVKEASFLKGNITVPCFYF